MKSAIYCRCSTDSQSEEELPIQGQLEECKRYALEHNIEIVRIYKDEGMTGSTESRPGYQQMLEDTRQKPPPFDIILTWRANRISRNVESRLANRRILRSRSVKIVSLHDPNIEGTYGQFIETVLAAADELYLKQVSEDTLRGLKLLARQGYSTGGRPPRGYRNKRTAVGLKPSGEPVMRTSWEIDPEYAPKVKKAFELCAAGRTSAEIVRETGICAAKNGLSALLRNRAYIGERIYNATRKGERKAIRIRNAPDELVIVPNCHETIIPLELFNRVQKIQDSKMPHRAGKCRRNKNVWLLSGLLYCREHKEPYIGTNNQYNAYYVCSARKQQTGTIYPCQNYKKEELEKLVFDTARNAIFSRERVYEGLKYLAREKEKNRKDDDAELDALRAEGAKAETELTRLQKAVIAGADPDALVKPLNEALAKKRTIEKAIEQVEKERLLRIPEATDAEVDRVIERLEGLFDTTDPGELKTALSYFIDRIEAGGNEMTIYYNFQQGEIVGLHWRPGGVEGNSLRIRVGIPRDAIPRRLLRNIF